MELSRRILYALLEITVAVLMFIAVGYNGWRCGGNIFSEHCARYEILRIVGILLTIAGIMSTIGAGMTLIKPTPKNRWLNTAVLVMTTLTMTLSTSGVIYYHYTTNTWLPVVAAFAMTFSLSLSLLITSDCFTDDK